MTPVSLRRACSISAPRPAGMMQMITRYRTPAGGAAAALSGLSTAAGMVTETRRDLGGNVGRHLLQRHHVEHAHSRCVEVGGDVDALENVVRMVAGGDDIEHFLLGIDRDAEHAKVLLAHAGAARVENSGALRPGFRRGIDP